MAIQYQLTGKSHRRRSFSKTPIAQGYADVVIFNDVRYNDRGDMTACASESDAVRPLRVLHMEDDAGLARLVQKKLPAERFQVDLARDGEQGLAMCEADCYDLLLVDYYMPVYNGLEVIRTLSGKGYLPPTIVITGAGTENLAVEAMKLGASDYVVKDSAGRYLDLLPAVMERALTHHRVREEKKLAEEALRESEELLRLISNALPACVSYMDKEQRFLFANKTCEQWFAKPASAMIGHHFTEIWGEPAHEKAREYLNRVFQGESAHYEDRLTFPDGATRYISATHVPHLGKEHAVRGCVSLVNDITRRKRVEEEIRQARDELERRVHQRTSQLVASNDKLRLEIRVRKQAQKELEASEERFRAIFESAQDCIFVKDRALRYTQVNPATEKCLGVPASKLVGKTSVEVFDKEVAKEIEEVDLRVLDGQSIEQSTTRLIGKDWVTFHDIKVPLRDSDGRIVGLCGITRDMTGLKRIERETADTNYEYLSGAMKKVTAQALSAAQSDSTILLLGESGSGKDYMARYIHDRSKRSGGPFFSINCAAVSAELAEAELFGHEPGAFTGAEGRKRGLLELAEGGTLLLNEIGELPVSQQAKLLSFLDTRSFTRLGGERSIQINARIIAATNRDLHMEANEGRFRLDLFYRLNVLSITVPPLRERKEDLPLLVRGILKKLVSEMRLHDIPDVDEVALRVLAAYEWPGNVRQLRNVIERALILSRDKDGGISFGPLGSGEPSQEEWTFTVRFPAGKSVNDIANDVKRALIRDILSRSQGNKQIAAQKLGISRFALFRMMKALGLSED